jgi:hypothetical protein
MSARRSTHHVPPVPSTPPASVSPASSSFSPPPPPPPSPPLLLLHRIILPPPVACPLSRSAVHPPFTDGTSRTSVLIDVPPDRMIPSSGRPPACDTSLALYGTHPVAVSTLSSSALSIRHPPSTMHSPRWRHLASSRTIAPLVE